MTWDRPAETSRDWAIAPDPDRRWFIEPGAGVVITLWDDSRTTWDNQNTLWDRRKAPEIWEKQNAN